MATDRDVVFAVVRDAVLESRPDVDLSTVCEDVALHELGLDSLERVDVVVASLDALALDLRPSATAGTRDIGELVDVLVAALGGEAGR